MEKLQYNPQKWEEGVVLLNKWRTILGVSMLAAPMLIAGVVAISRVLSGKSEWESAGVIAALGASVIGLWLIGLRTNLEISKNGIEIRRRSWFFVYSKTRIEKRNIKSVKIEAWSQWTGSRSPNSRFEFYQIWIKGDGFKNIYLSPYLYFTIDDCLDEAIAMAEKISDVLDVPLEKGEMELKNTINLSTNRTRERESSR